MKAPKIHIQLFGAELLKKRSRDKLNKTRFDVKAILLKYGKKILNQAKKGCPVKTGYLKGSLGYRLLDNGWAIFIGTTKYPVAYAAAQEFRNYKHKNGIPTPARYINRAVQMYINELNQKFKDLPD